jgi:hypothetical protein
MKHKIIYASRKGKQMFVGFIEGESYVKMKKPGKKKPLVFSWERPFVL